MDADFQYRRHHFTFYKQYAKILLYVECQRTCHYDTLEQKEGIDWEKL